MSVKINWQSCGSLKRSLGMAASAMSLGRNRLPTPTAIPKSCGLEDATQAYLQAGILDARKSAQTPDTRHSDCFLHVLSKSGTLTG